jgi:hypothetical protein
MSVRILCSISVGLALSGCAETSVQIRSRAARDLSCAEEHTRIVDAEAGVYRMEGCGLVASYVCAENSALDMHCDRVYLGKMPEAPTRKTGGGASLAKAR